ncbi:hypothetical protein, partial [Virgibacillus salexigens]|uniref:hypothetical protein n=1 Tax=Virgibacillus salexigens TaxID=61016 RepID=UPI00190B9103
LHDKDHDLKQDTKHYEIIRQDIQQKEVQSNRMDVELENLLSYLQNVYTISYDKAKQSYEKAKNKE